MRMLRAVLAVVILACGVSALVASAPAANGAAAMAHPEPKDVDGDTVLNELDNCPTTPNGAQVNTDLALNPATGDALGDACDPDDDNDGFADSIDNCRIVPNDQTDTDGDGHGDACPPVDTDGDGRLDEDDNCAQVPNADQQDLDGDDKGDACDRDDDNDFFDDPVDNCPTVWNPTTSTAPPFVQADLDGDGIGSACDPEESIVGPPGSVTTPGTGGGPGGTGPTTARDRTAPTLTIAVPRRQRLADSGTSLIVKASCSEACSLDAVLAADAKAAKRAHLGTKRLVLASGAWSLAGAGRTYVFARWKPAARKLRTGRRLTAVLQLTAADAAGNERTVKKTIELRR
jgi:hypothetical protein